MVYLETSFQRRLKTNQSILLHWNNHRIKGKKIRSGDYERLDHICQSFCKDSNHYLCMMQLENNLAFWLILTKNKIPITVKVSIYFLSPVAFKTYQSQYKSKYSIRFTQSLIEDRILSFLLSQTLLSRTFFAGPVGVRDSGCPMYVSYKNKLALF